jgi:HPt (histidine-containing phosphotransfer) domain-containing protein
MLPMLENPQTARETLLRQLHTVLGSAGMVGARQVEYLARQIQLAVKENRLEALQGTAEILRRALRRYEREFDRRLDSGADTDVIKRAAP